MARRYDMLKDVNVASHKIWRIKARVIRLWRVPNFNDRNYKPSIEMVVMDEENDRIHCSIRSNHVSAFENEISEGKVYMISNFAVALNAFKFKPTRHEFRVFFKKETNIRLIEESVIPLNGFCFVPFADILHESQEDAYLIDVIGLLCGKGDLIEYTREGKSCNYIVIELDNLEGEKLRCTLWEAFAPQFLTHLEENPQNTHVIVLQFAKMKMYKGVMGVSNTTYNSRLLIDEENHSVQEFRQRIHSMNSTSSQQLTLLAAETPYSAEDDLLNKRTYKSIADLRDVRETGVFVTIGIVKDIESEYSWWYRACKKCNHGLKEDVRRFFCKKCNSYPTTFVPRYCIHLLVVDETDSASFILYDREAMNQLNISASDLRLSYMTRGGDKDLHPEEIDVLKDQKFIFKVQMKIQDLNSFEPFVINVVKLCKDEAIMQAFVKKYEIDEEQPFIPDYSELSTPSADLYHVTKDNMSQTCDNLVDLGIDTFTTPSKTTSGEKKWSAEPVKVVGEESVNSSTKLTKLIKQEK